MKKIGMLFLFMLNNLHAMDIDIDKVADQIQNFIEELSKDDSDASSENQITDIKESKNRRKINKKRLTDLIFSTDDATDDISSDDAYSSSDDKLTPRKFGELYSFCKYINKYGTNGLMRHVEDEKHPKSTATGKLIHNDNILEIEPEVLALFGMLKNKVKVGQANSKQVDRQKDEYQALKVALQYAKEANPYQYQKYIEQMAKKIYSKDEYKDVLPELARKNSVKFKRKGDRQSNYISAIANFLSSTLFETETDSTEKSAIQDHPVVTSLLEGELPNTFGALLTQITSLVTDHHLIEKNNLVEKKEVEVSQKNQQLQKKEGQVDTYKKTTVSSVIANLVLIATTAVTLYSQLNGCTTTGTGNSTAT